MPMAPPGEPIIMPDVLKPEPREELPPERTLFEEEPVDYSTGSKFIEKAYPFLRGAAEEFTLGMAEFPDEWQPKPGINEALYGAGKFAGFFGPALLYGGKATQIAIKPLLKKLGTRASGQIASRIIGSGVPLGVASAITDIKDIEGMPERFIHGFMFGSILGATSHLNFHKLAPATNLLIRQFSSRAMANMANIYEPTALKEIIEGSISGEYSPDLPNKVFDELIFTVFSFRKASPKEILDTLDKINPEIERLNLPVETWKVNPDGTIETSTGKIVRINAFGKSVEDIVKPPKKPPPKKNYYRFFPKDSPQSWRDVADATSGKMIRPFKDLQTGKFVEYEEYKHGVPKQLRGKQGFAPDEVSQLLGLEDSQALYRALEYKKIEPVKDMPEHVQAAENEVLTLEADILKGTKKSGVEVSEFIDNDFMDGERLREITQEVLRGEKAKVDAIKEVRELIESTVGKPEKGERLLPKKMKPGERELSDAEIVVERAKVEKEVGGKIAPFGKEAKEIKAVIQKKKNIAIVEKSVWEKNTHPDLASMPNKLSSTEVWVFRKNNKAVAMRRIKAVDELVAKAGGEGLTEAGQRRLGRLFDYSEADIETYIKWGRKLEALEPEKVVTKEAPKVETVGKLSDLQLMKDHLMKTYEDKNRIKKLERLIAEEEVQLKKAPKVEGEYFEQRATGFESVKESAIQKPTPEKTIRAMVEGKGVEEIASLKKGKMPEEIAVLDKIIAEKTVKEAKQIRMIPEEELIKGGEGGYVKLGREERLRRIKEKGLYAEELPKEKIEPLPKLTEAELESARKAGKVEELLPSERAKGLTFKEELELEKELPIRMISEKAIRKGDEAGYVKIEVQKTFGDSIKTRAYQNIFDRFHSIKKLSDIVKKEGTELPPHKDPYIGIRT